MKKLNLVQITVAANSIKVPVAALRAVIEVECKGDGFNADGTPVVLFERHIFKQRLITNGLDKVAATAEKQRPDLCQSRAGGYGKYTEQHARLMAAVNYHRASALEACSWGIGQVMGYHWQDLGYSSLQAFVNLMYHDEASQLNAMCRFIVKNNLVDELQRLDWAGFARGYNGPAFAKNHYDDKLAAAYAKFSDKNAG